MVFYYVPNLYFPVLFVKYVLLLQYKSLKYFSDNKNKEKLTLEFQKPWEFPASLMVGTLGFHCHSPGSIPNWGTEVIHVVWPKKKKNPKNKNPNSNNKNSEKQEKLEERRGKVWDRE